MSTMISDAGPPEFRTLVVMVVEESRAAGFGETDVLSTVNTGGPVAGESNRAVTERFADIVTAQGPVPAHAPLQPPKVEPAAAVALRLTGMSLA